MNLNANYIVFTVNINKIVMRDDINNIKMISQPFNTERYLQLKINVSHLSRIVYIAVHSVGTWLVNGIKSENGSLSFYRYFLFSVNKVNNVHKHHQN